MQVHIFYRLVSDGSFISKIRHLSPEDNFIMRIKKEPVIKIIFQHYLNCDSISIKIHWLVIPESVNGFIECCKAVEIRIAVNERETHALEFQKIFLIKPVFQRGIKSDLFSLMFRVL